jgi:hypothetical protein
MPILTIDTVSTSDKVFLQKGNRIRLGAGHVAVIGSKPEFFINDVLVWLGSDLGLAPGRVGLGAYTRQSDDEIRVDWATMSTPAPPTEGDIDGDGKADKMVFRPGNSTWYMLQSGNSDTYASTQWGIFTDVPISKWTGILSLSCK